MTTADDMTPHLRQTVEEAYEASVKYADLPDAPNPNAAFELSSLLSLALYMAKHPDATDYSADFGEYTIDLLNMLIERCSTEIFTMHSNKQHRVNNARLIGEELLAIDKAVEQGQIAFGNMQFKSHSAALMASREEHHKVNRSFTETRLFEELSARRAELRTELLQIFTVSE
jgi:hypothetical protein